MTSGAVKPRPKRAAIQKKPRGKFHHPDLREALVLAATDALEREGHAGLSLRALATRIGVTQPAVYRHFPSKEALLVEVARRGLLGFDAAQQAALEAYDDPFAAIEAAGRAYVRFCIENPGWFRLCFSRFGTEQIRVQDVAPEMRSHMALTAAISRVVGRSGENVYDVYRMMWAQVHGLAVLVVERSFQLVKTDAERLVVADAAFAMFIGALRARFASA